jgi:hypothetical protein
MYDTASAIDEILAESKALGPAWRLKVVATDEGIHYWYFWRRSQNTFDNDHIILCRNMTGYSAYCSTSEQPAHNIDVFGRGLIYHAYGATTAEALARLRHSLLDMKLRLNGLAQSTERDSTHA